MNKLANGARFRFTNDENARVFVKVSNYFAIDTTDDKIGLNCNLHENADNITVYYIQKGF